MSATNTIREHARSRGALNGADAQALEGSLCQAERELAASAGHCEAYRIEAGVWRDRAEARKAEIAAGDAAVLKLGSDLGAATARAEAAERNSLVEAGEVIRLEDALQRKDAACSELEAIREETAKRLQRAESEAAALRAEVDRLKGLDNVQRAVSYLDRAQRAEQLVARCRQHCPTVAECNETGCKLVKP